ncbi:MAG: LysM peptidoglycan-binding domain-containing protein [Verrucomicrobiota bacterium]
MKLKFALIFSVCILTTGVGASKAIAAKASSGEVKVSHAVLTQQLSQEKEKVKQLETEVAELKKTVTSLKSMLGNSQNSTAEATSTGPQKYVIKGGETITEIANRHHISREKLMKMNGISENQQIYIGDELIIPATLLAETEEDTIVVASADQTPAPIKTTPAPAEKVIPIAWTLTEKSEKVEKAKSQTAPAPVVEVAAKKEVEVKTTTPVIAEVIAPEKIETPETITVADSAPAVVIQDSAPVITPSAPEKPTVTEKITLVESPEIETTVAEVKTPDITPTSPETEKGYSFYTIKSGDNLGKIAKNHGITIGSLMSFNQITNPNKIGAGQKLKIPSKETAKSLSKVKPSPVTTLVSADNDKPKAGDAYGVYTVQTGDTLYGLARDFFTTEKELQNLNKMGKNTKIVPGQELIVPTAEYFKKNELANN